MVEFAAIFFDATRSGGLTCVARPRAGGLEVVHGDAVIDQIEYRAVEVSLEGVGGRYLCFAAHGDGKARRLFVADRAIADAIEAQGAPYQLVGQLRQVAIRRSRRATGRYLVVGLLAAVIAAVGLGGWFGFAWLVRQAVRQVPVAWEESLAEKAADQVLADIGLCDDPALARGIQELGMRLVSGLGQSPSAFRVQVLASFMGLPRYRVPFDALHSEVAARVHRCAAVLRLLVPIVLLPCRAPAVVSPAMRLHVWSSPLPCSNAHRTKSVPSDALAA